MPEHSIIQPSGSDDTRAVQAGIERAAAGDGIVRLARGVFHISETITISRTAGLKIIGTGCRDPSNFGPGWSDIGRSIGSCFYWSGLRGGTMFNVTASPDTVFKHLMFDGRTKAGVLVELDTTPGWSTTAARLEHVAVQGAEVGIQLGRPSHPINDNNDIFTFESLTLMCDIGVRICNNQSLCHRFSYVDNYSRIGIDIRQGGCITVDRLLQSGPDKNRTGVVFSGGGINAATLSITNARIEAGCLLTCGGANQIVDVSSYCDAAGPNGVPWKIGPSALVSVRASSFQGTIAELAGAPGAKAVLIVHDSALAKPTRECIIYKNVHAYAAVEGVFIQWTNQPA